MIIMCSGFLTFIHFFPYLYARVFLALLLVYSFITCSYLFKANSMSMKVHVKIRGNNAGDLQCDRKNDL